MKKFWKKYRVWIIILAVIALLAAVGLMSNNTDPHAGHNHSTGAESDPHAGHDHSDYTADKSYSITTDQNGLYTVTVKNAHGETILSRGSLKTKPTCTKVSDYVLLVGNFSTPTQGNSWGVYCNVSTDRVSSLYNGVLATKGNYVIYGTQQNGKWQVVVRDAFDATVYLKNHVLEDAVSPDSGSVFKSASLTQGGDLHLTYWTGTAEKSVTIALPKA